MRFTGRLGSRDSLLGRIILGLGIKPALGDAADVALSARVKTQLSLSAQPRTAIALSARAKTDVTLEAGSI